MIQPSAVTLLANEKIAFVSDGVDWTLSPVRGQFDNQTKVYTAPTFLLNSRTIYITARSPDNPVGSPGTELEFAL